MDDLPVLETAAVASDRESETVAPTAHWGAVHLLALIVVIAACWAARGLLVPIMLAMFLALIANPLVTRLRGLYIPRWIGAIFVVFGGVALAIALTSQLVAPATDWMQKAPRELRQVAPKLKGLVRQVDAANKAAASIVTAAGAGQPNSPRSAPVVEDKPAPPNL